MHSDYLRTGRGPTAYRVALMTAPTVVNFGLKHNQNLRIRPRAKWLRHFEAVERVLPAHKSFWGFYNWSRHARAKLPGCRACGN
jgi:hypothetical protein